MRFRDNKREFINGDILGRHGQSVDKDQLRLRVGKYGRHNTCPFARGGRAGREIWKEDPERFID